jgi:cytochrome c biogenesis protein CcdA
MPVDTIIKKHVKDPLADAEVDRLNREIDKQRDSYARSINVQLTLSLTLLIAGIVVVVFNGFWHGYLWLATGGALCIIGLGWFFKARSDRQFGDLTGTVFKAQNKPLDPDEIKQVAALVEGHPAVAKVVLGWSDRGLMPRKQHLSMLQALAADLEGEQALQSAIDSATKQS